MTSTTAGSVDFNALRAAVPDAMAALPQWLLWRYETYDGDKKPRKVPYWVSGRKRKGAQGSDSDRGELQTVDIAITHLARGRYDGLGFAFLPGDGLIGIDIDGAIDADTGEVSARCQAIVQACNSYTELSPSGRGVHIIVAGEATTLTDDSIGLEVYCGRQYFTFTGRRWGDTPAQVAPLDDAVLRRLQATVQAARAARKPAQRTAAPKAGPAQPVAGVDDFARVNAAALALLDQWVPALLPAARKQEGTGAWRVTSRDLGRDLQEDLSLAPPGAAGGRGGIVDFGREKNMTAIDVVVEFGGKTPGDALRWLAGQIGLQLADKAARKRAAAPADAADTPGTGSAVEGGGAGGGGGGGGGKAPAAEKPPKPERPAWAKALKTDRNGYADCRENLYLLLTMHPALAGLVGWDEFAHRVVKLKPMPWESPPGEWLPQDDYSLGLWLMQHLGMTIKAEATLFAGVGMAAWANRFHPVKGYLNELKPWDGTERLPFWLSECLGADDTPYTRMVGTWFLMGMVARVLRPGCQMDYMIVLEGLQGRGKSSALAALCKDRDWFDDTPKRLGNNDSMLSLAGKWLTEMGELAGLNKAEVEEIKQYLSSRVDRVREPFARRHVDRPRSCVFGGTTNATEYFKDPTGARRFWPVLCRGLPECDGNVDMAKLVAWRDQLFAEAKDRLASADPEVARYYPTRAESEEFLQPEQEQREIGDPWLERVATWVDSSGRYGESMEEIRDVESFTSFELLAKCIGVPPDRIDGQRGMATRIGTTMAKLGWTKVRDAKPPRLWRYVRPRPPAAETPPAQHESGVAAWLDGDGTAAGGPAQGGQP